MKDRLQLESELSDVERRIVPLSGKLDSLLKEFSSSIVDEVECWISQEIRRQIEANHERVNVAGIDYVRQVKADVSALIDRLDAVCVEALGSSFDWPHNKNLQERDFYSFSGSDFFSEVFKRAVSSLGGILHKHGLIDEGAAGKSWRRAGVKGYEYVYSPSFDGRKNRIAIEYRELLKTHWDLKRSALKLSEEIERAKSRELWDEA